MPLENMSAHFKGLPMGDLIGAPLNAACDAQVRLAMATADFIRVVGLEPPLTKDGQPLPPAEAAKADQWSGKTRTVKFAFNRPVMIGHEPQDPHKQNGNELVVPPKPIIGSERVEIEVPVLAIVNVPALSIKTVDVTFDMEVKSSESSKETSDQAAGFEGEGKLGWGPVSVTVKVHGSVATHKENTRTSDNSAKYHVAVHAADNGMPEGLARVLDMLAQSIAPTSVKPVEITNDTGSTDTVHAGDAAHTTRAARAGARTNG